ncbi:MAG: mevalonate kinase [Candidatus Methanomethyliaceae archaeon]|nr:mevalonate kinase [Candidatus Methanomethyliaceae archaeon]MDW7970788.1 mevalonate kinase [Nitrososphaerota archaeon]
MKVTFSAPGKITIFGEHAVVYGRPAIVGSIDKRIYVTMERRNDNCIKILAEDLSFKGLSIKIGDRIEVEANDRILEALKYIVKAIEIASEYINEKSGMNISISSEMPVGAGLGTSAAITVATLAAYSYILGHELSLNEIAKLGHTVELTVQGIASPMDTTISTFGGLIYLMPNVGFEQLSLNNELDLILGHVKRDESTAKMVKKVREIKERNEKIIEMIMSSIGAIAEEGKWAIIKGDVEKLGLLMNINHGLLESLGVSTKLINDMVYASRNVGAIGAKLTGAGGGGCIIALCPGRKKEVSLAIKLVGGNPMDFKLSMEGLKRHNTQLL